MARRDSHFMYDKAHNVQIFNKNGYLESRNVEITIIDFSDYMQIKVRDGTDFVFNYTLNLDSRQFEMMRNDQNLDVDFKEFKTNVVDMLEQAYKQEMYLKCEIDSSKCKLIFYGKSRLKLITFLFIDLQVTNQKEIFDEMNNNILELQNANKNLSSQLQHMKKLLQDKDFEVKHSLSVNEQLERQFLSDLQQLKCTFSTKLQDCSTKLIDKILVLSQKLLKLIRNVEIIKSEAVSKSNSNARLLQNMENLRLELVEASSTISELKRENYSLRNLQHNSEEKIAELNRAVLDKDNGYVELRRKKEEIEQDVKQATLIIAQKTAANEELAKDLIQANQMLVNFNHLYDTKNKELEDLQNSVAAKEIIVQEQKQRLYETQKQFEEYRSRYNAEEMKKLTQELFATNRRVEEVEKLNRDTVKLNELLTRKLASGDFMQRHVHQ